MTGAVGESSARATGKTSETGDMGDIFDLFDSPGAVPAVGAAAEAGGAEAVSPPATTGGSKKSRASCTSRCITVGLLSVSAVKRGLLGGV